MLYQTIKLNGCLWEHISLGTLGKTMILLTLEDGWNATWLCYECSRSEEIQRLGPSEKEVAMKAEPFTSQFCLVFTFLFLSIHFINCFSSERKSSYGYVSPCIWSFKQLMKNNLLVESIQNCQLSDYEITYYSKVTTFVLLLVDRLLSKH